jgi:signal transduction histidine kinase/ligand-binding sensor domain-containing protein
LCEDGNGRLWIGTQQNGLFQIAQGTVRHFTTADGLLDDGVTSLEADKQGLVWIGTKSGLNLWNGQDFKSFTTRDGLPDKFVSGVNVARSGTVWITTRVGMCRFINGHIVPFVFQTESQGRSPEYLGAYEDRRGNLWAFGDTYLINLVEGKRFNYFRSSESSSVRIWSLCEGSDGRLWIGTSGRGLFCFEDNRFQPVTLGENRWSYDVRAIYEDHEGNLWLGTSGGGLVQLRPQSMHVLMVEQGLPAGAPTALTLDPDGRVYVGMRRAGLFMGESGRFDRISGSGGLGGQNFITSLCAARDGTIWAGTLGSGLYGLHNGREIHFTTANGLTDDKILAVCVDTQGSVWASTSVGTVHYFDGQGIVRFDAAQGLPGTPVTAMIPSSSGGLWLGTQDGEIFREKNGKFTSIAAAKVFENHAVLALVEGENDRLWIGTDGGGLASLGASNCVCWNSTNGLPDDIVAGLAEDDAKNLWLATGAGIYRVNRSDLHKALRDPQVSLACKMVSDTKTIPESTLVAGGTRAVLSSDGELWFATSEGILNVDTHQSDAVPATFPVYIESATFNNEPPISLLRGELLSSTNDTKQPFNIPVDVRSLEIHFTALSFIAPDDIQFRHKLEGFDPDWVNDGDVRFARFTGRLPYGHYRFRVAARNFDGTWQEAAETFSFIVPTPIYLQNWAIFSYGLFAVALVTGIVRVVSHRRLRFALARLEQQQSLERERMRIARDMHDDMGSKLTKISFLSEHAQVDAEPAGPMTAKMQAIAQTSRELLQTMDEIVWVVNPRNDTLENLVTYLSHYAIEYFQNTSVECDLRLPQEVPHYPLSSEVRHNLFLTFEEALNNVLKHSGASKVQVEMKASAIQFEVQIADNGHGFKVPSASAPVERPTGKRGGNGLKNMQQRLADIGGECLIVSQPGTGTTITVRIRLEKNRT